MSMIAKISRSHQQLEEMIGNRICKATWVQAVISIALKGKKCGDCGEVLELSAQIRVRTIQDDEAHLDLTHSQIVEFIMAELDKQGYVDAGVKKLSFADEEFDSNMNMVTRVACHIDVDLT